jgi:hypothetical protein
MRSSLLPSVLSVAELPEDMDMAQLPFPDEEALEDAAEAAAKDVLVGAAEVAWGLDIVVVWCGVDEWNVDCVV